MSYKYFVSYNWGAGGAVISYNTEITLKKKITEIVDIIDIEKHLTDKCSEFVIATVTNYILMEEINDEL